MKDDKPSTTAAYVASARAYADETGSVRGFSDPIARLLLPADQRPPSPSPTGKPQSMREAIQQVRGHYMALRTVAIDEGIRAVVDGVDQLVVLGAGLDSRAWRMDELADVTVFEVDHPATQRYKQSRVDILAPRAREVRFVTVNFERDSLADALDAAGHDPTRPTIWVWEGVIMYLEEPAIAATMDIVDQRSAPGSRLLATYQTPGITQRIVGFFAGLAGEPFRSLLTPVQLARLLTRPSCLVTRDEGRAQWFARWSNPTDVRVPGGDGGERMATVDWPAEPR